MFKKTSSLFFQDHACVLGMAFSFVVPCFGVINKRVLTKLVHKMAGSDNESANVLLGMNINVHYALFIAIRLSGSHISTVSCTVAIDFILHLRMAYQLIQLRNKTTTDLNEHEQRRRNEKRTILKLVLAEMCEGLVPLAYAIGFSMVHYGPNSEILEGSIGGNTKDQDEGKIYGVMFLLFVIDMVSCLANAYQLWKLGKINITHEFCSILERYWYFMLINFVITSSWS